MLATLRAATLKFAKDLFTAPDGETWALNRFYSVPVLGVGLAIPIIALLRGQVIEMIDVGALLVGVSGAVLLLLKGANGIDVDWTDPKHPKITSRKPPSPKE